MKLKPYPEYKDSEIKWIGKIPEEWENFRLKYVVNEFIAGGTPSSDNEKFWAQTEDEGIPWVTIGDMTNEEIIKDTTKKITKEGLANKRLRILKKGTLIYSIFASLGKVSILGIDATTNQAILGLITNKKIDNNFLKYYLRSLEEPIIILSNANTQNNLNSTIVKNIEISIPENKQDQTTIANYLDKKTAKIDALIEKDKKLIELLKEKRTALINHAVTKGLPVRRTQTGLDPNAKMKDSGIEWIGEIPEEWEVNKIKNTNYVKGRIGWHGLTSEEYQDEGAFLVTGTDFFNGHIDWSSCHHVSWERYKEDPYIHLKENDVLITKDGTIGKVALIENLPDKATLNSGVFVIRALNKKHISHFMFWILNSLVFEKFFDYVKRGATISHLYQETFERFIFPIPSLDEQRAIAKYLDKETLKIDKTIQKIEEKIKLLEEYKKSLIHHTVTGKIDVREVKI